MNSCRKTALAAAICTALSTGHAGAATFNVTNTDDGGAGSLRDALAQANPNGEADIIDLSAISGQTINLTSGALEIEDDELTIEGAGVTLDAGGNSRAVYSYNADVTINDLTITGGQAASEPPPRGIVAPGVGGGILFREGNLEINDSVITGNSATGDGGGLGFSSEYGSLAINDSVVSVNSAGSGGGGMFAISKYGSIEISGTEISSNTAGQDGGGLIAISLENQVRLVDSAISGNEVTGPGRALSGWREELASARGTERAFTQGDYGSGIGGGALAYSFFGSLEVLESTISGNSAPVAGGFAVYSLAGSVLLEDSTISANTANAAGAGILFAKYDTVLRNSTISGNTADTVGGIVLYSGDSLPDVNGPELNGGPPSGSVLVDFTTITANTSNGEGAALTFLTPWPITINASLISGNDGTPEPDIAFEPGSTNTEAAVNFSLVGIDPTSGTLNKDAASTALSGQDPVLGPLGDNGGPTFSHLPGATSPLVDAVTPGAVGCGDTVTSDQRGETRPFGAGCDIGSIERGAVAPPPPALPVPAMDRIGLLLMAGLLGLAGLLGFRRRSEQKF